MKTVNRKTELIKIISNLLRSECIYKQDNRSGWICGFGYGKIAYIEDHRNELTIRIEHYADSSDIISQELISSMIPIDSISADEIIDHIGIYDKSSDFNTFIEPDAILIKLAKEKCWFGRGIDQLEGITDEDIAVAIDDYYLDREKEHKEQFSYYYQ